MQVCIIPLDKVLICVVLHYVFQSFYVNIQLSKNINWLYSGVHCPTSFVLLSLHLHYYYMQLLLEILQLFKFFLPLVTNGIFYWCLASILLLYSAILKMSILFLNFFLFFCAFLYCLHFYYMHSIKFYAYFLKFFLNNF